MKNDTRHSIKTDVGSMRLITDQSCHLAVIANPQNLSAILGCFQSRIVDCFGMNARLNVKYRHMQTYVAKMHRSIEMTSF